MENCVNEFLMESVSDSSIPKLGELKLFCARNGGYLQINADTANKVKLTATDGTLASEYAKVSGTIGLTADQGVNTVYISAIPKYNLTALLDVFPVNGLSDYAYCKISSMGCIHGRLNDTTAALISLNINDIAEWENKNLLQTIDFDFLNFGYGHIRGNLSSLAGCTGLTNLTILSGKNIKGNLTDLVGKPLQTLRLEAVDIKGELSALGSITTLTTLGFFNSNASGLSNQVTGTVEAFVAAQRTAGRTTGSITVKTGLSAVTFNGSAIAYSSTDRTLSWTADSITFA